MILNKNFNVSLAKLFSQDGQAWVWYQELIPIRCIAVHCRVQLGDLVFFRIVILMPCFTLTYIVPDRLQKRWQFIGLGNKSLCITGVDTFFHFYVR